MNTAPLISPPNVNVLTSDCRGHRLLDSGNHRKLEQFGTVRIIRDEPKAWWRPALPHSEWNSAHAVHKDDSHGGKWLFPHGEIPPSWEFPLSLPLAHPLRLQLRFTDNSKQIGIFPEQYPHWHWLATHPPPPSASPPRLLNLFAYTGAASLVCAASGWHVTHVDASKPAVAWARRNAELSGLTLAPIRWIIEDATKFVQREIRRKNHYDAILLDPPAFGRGPNNEFWKIERHLPPLLELCRDLLSPNASLILLTLYTIDASCLLCHNLLQQATLQRNGSIASGELTLRDESSPRFLPLSLWGRWSQNNDLR
ncbi:MAG: class I SAM-dependent methyltransferase [Puniceicoccales bacterium]|nr:class I SAM-dependent methyltransferase [Puniceicoccales bacterium]